MTGFVEVKMEVPLQALSSGPNSRNVIVPVGLTPPVSEALSEIGPPTETDGDAVVEIAGGVLVTTEDSFGSLQAPETGRLLASPL